MVLLLLSRCTFHIVRRQRCAGDAALFLAALERPAGVGRGRRGLQKVEQWLRGRWEVLVVGLEEGVTGGGWRLLRGVGFGVTFEGFECGWVHLGFSIRQRFVIGIANSVGYRLEAERLSVQYKAVYVTLIPSPLILISEQILALPLQPGQVRPLITSSLSVSHITLPSLSLHFLSFPSLLVFPLPHSFRHQNLLLQLVNTRQPNQRLFRPCPLPITRQVRLNGFKKSFILLVLPFSLDSLHFPIQTRLKALILDVSCIWHAQ